HFAPTEVISSDFCRGLVADDENDQSARARAPWTGPPRRAPRPRPSPRRPRPGQTPRRRRPPPG
ncbi:hypothetical protein, partial [Streptomyces sp. NPDC004726]